METNQLIKEKLKEGLELHKRRSLVNGILTRCTASLFDAYRHLDLAIQHCDDSNMRERLELVRMLLGNDKEISPHIKEKSSTVISHLQTIATEFGN